MTNGGFRIVSYMLVLLDFDRSYGTFLSRSTAQVYSVSKKNIPLRFSEIFFSTAENFKAKFYTPKPIVRSYLSQIIKSYSFISKFDKVMPY